jgi:hypothetical protein
MTPNILKGFIMADEHHLLETLELPMPTTSGRTFRASKPSEIGAESRYPQLSRPSSLHQKDVLRRPVPFRTPCSRVLNLDTKKPQAVTGISPTVSTNSAVKSQLGMSGSVCPRQQM